MTALEDALRRALSGDKAPDPIRAVIAAGLAGDTDPGATALNTPTLEADLLARLTDTTEEH